MSVFVPSHRVTPVVARTAPLVPAPAAAPAATRPIGLVVPAVDRAIEAASEAGASALSPKPTPPAPDLAPQLALLAGVVERAARERREKLAGVEARLRAASAGPARLALEAEAAELRRALADLGGFARAVARLGRNPATTAADVARVRELVLLATGSVTAHQRGKALIQVEDRVRNVGRVPMSDRQLFQATVGLTERAGQLRDELARLREALAAAGKEPARAAAIQLQMRALERGLEAVERAKAALDRMADHPATTPDQARQALALANELAASPDPGTARKAAHALEQLARTVAHPRRDKGLADMAIALERRVGELDDQLANLADKARTTADPRQRAALAREAAALERTRAILERLRAAADDLADRPGTSGATRQRAGDLLRQALRTSDPAYLASIEQEVQRLVSAGGVVLAEGAAAAYRGEAAPR